MATASKIDAVLREIADRIQTNQKRLTAGRAQIAYAEHVRPCEGLPRPLPATGRGEGEPPARRQESAPARDLITSKHDAHARGRHERVNGNRAGNVVSPGSSSLSFPGFVCASSACAAGAGRPIWAVTW